MTLKEAIESGKPFRRASWQLRRYVFKFEPNINGLSYISEDGHRVGIDIEDLTADDWEIKEELKPREIWLSEQQYHVIKNDNENGYTFNFYGTREQAFRLSPVGARIVKLREVME